MKDQDLDSGVIVLTDVATILHVKEPYPSLTSCSNVHVIPVPFVGYQAFY